MGRIDDAEWLRLLGDALENAGYATETIAIVDGEGIARLPERMLHVAYEHDGQMRDVHIAYPVEPTAVTADDAFRQMHMIRTGSGNRPPPSRKEVERIHGYLSEAAEMPMGRLFVLPVPMSYSLLASYQGYDKRDRYGRWDVLVETAGSLMAQSSLRNELLRLKDGRARRERMSLPEEERYLVDPIIIHAMDETVANPVRHLDRLIEMALNDGSIMEVDRRGTDGDGFELENGLLRMTRGMRNGCVRIRGGTICIIGMRMPQTMAQALVGERFERLAAGTAFGDLVMKGVRQLKNDVSIEIDRTPISLGQARDALRRRWNDASTKNDTQDGDEE